jgi:hypothetical protein
MRELHRCPARDPASSNTPDIQCLLGSERINCAVATHKKHYIRNHRPRSQHGGGARFASPPRLVIMTDNKFHTSTLSPPKHRAIAALLAETTDNKAASTAEISLQQLRRWKKETEFDTEYRMQRHANHRQQMACLRQVAVGAAARMRNTVCDEHASPATRLDAAIQIIELAEEAIEIEDFDADLLETERATKASRAALVILPGSGVSRSAGHGAKSSRTKEEAVIQYLRQPSIAEAARVTGIGTQTLYAWIAHDPEFNALLMSAEQEVFGRALIVFQQGVRPSRLLISESARGTGATSLKACRFIYDCARAAAVEDRRARVAAAEPVTGSAGTSEPGTRSKVIGRNLHQRLQRLKARLLPTRAPDDFEYFHAAEGKAIGTSVMGPNGFLVWSKPPAGFQEGQPVPVDDDDTSAPNRVAA